MLSVEPNENEVSFPPQNRVQVLVNRKMETGRPAVQQVMPEVVHGPRVVCLLLRVAMRIVSSVLYKMILANLYMTKLIR